MSTTICKALILVFVVFHAWAGNAKDVVLFEDGWKVYDYQDRVLLLREGDVVYFSNGIHFQIVKILGSGGSEKILAINQDRAIRISLYYQGDLKYYLKGETLLRRMGIPMAKVFRRQSVPGEFVMVERHKGETLADLLWKPSRYSPEELQRRFDGLVDFAETTYAFDVIDDMRPDNLFWTNGRWILIDWDDRHQLSQGEGKDVFLYGWDLLPDDLLARMRERVRHKRATISCRYTIPTKKTGEKR